MMVDHIFNGEQGAKVREKLNEVIDRTNALVGVEIHGGQGGNPHGTKASQVTQTNAALGANVQTALDTLERKQSTDNSNNNSHSNNQNNPHNVRAEQVSQNNPELGDDVQEALNDLHGAVVELVEMLPEKADLDHIDGLDTHIQLRRGTNPLEAWNDDLMVAELFFHYTKGQLWSKLNDGTMVMIGSQSFIEDAPEDGYTYGREDGQWVRVGATEVQDEPPENPVVGTLWYDQKYTCELYVYDGKHWVSMTGGGGGSGDGEFPENIVLDDVGEMLKNVALAREIDDNGDGVWRQFTTSDLVTENNQPMFRDASGRFTKSDEGVIRNQQEANWYLRDRIVEGVEKQDKLEDKIKALEGAVGEHSLIFSSGMVPSDGEFTLTDGMSAVNSLSDGSVIVVSGKDRDGNSIAIDRITEGDVLRLSDIGQYTAELKITSVNGGGEFGYEKLFGELDRLSNYPYDFTVLSSFDPAGLATIEYVDGQDDKKLDISGGTMTGALDIKTPRGPNAHNNIRIHGRVGGNEGYLLRDYQRRDEDNKDDYIEYFGGSVGDNTIMNKGQIRKLIEDATGSGVTTWKYVKDKTSPNDGEFSYRVSGNQVVLVMGNKTSDGILWVHGHGREDSIGFEDSFFVSVSQSDGNFNLISDVEDFEFSRKNKPNTHVYLDDAEWEIDLVEGQRYCIRIPGLLPLVKF